MYGAEAGWTQLFNGCFSSTELGLRHTQPQPPLHHGHGSYPHLGPNIRNIPIDLARQGGKGRCHGTGVPPGLVAERVPGRRGPVPW